MFRLSLIGKKYIDTILEAKRVDIGETNQIINRAEKLGGLRNLLIPNHSETITTIYETGEKQAIIVSDLGSSTRTSYTQTIVPSLITTNLIEQINSNSDWAHVSYLDDIEEQFKYIENITIPYSLDFCTDRNREKYIEVMKKASIILDSSERIELYKGLCLAVPIVLHAPEGIQILVEGQIVFEETNQRLSNLSVNGAGDIYASYFIKHYHDSNRDLYDSAKKAMLKTTKLLVALSSEPSYNR